MTPLWQLRRRLVRACGRLGIGGTYREVVLWANWSYRMRQRGYGASAPSLRK